MADSTHEDRYAEFETALAYEFVDREILKLALTHRSYCAENGNVESNERLEFLGDAVLGLSMTHSLFHARPEQPEGDLAKARAEVVSAPGLAEAARRLGVGEVLFLGRGEELSGGRDKESILADAMEAVIAAIYLDAGWERAAEFVTTQLATGALDAQSTPGLRDYKTRLQEIAAELHLSPPEYAVDSTGPDHDRTFRATVTVGEVDGTGRGSSKKLAQQQAAAIALEKIQEMSDRTTAESGQGEVSPATVPCGGMQ